jgi:hypothetical protein
MQKPTGVVTPLTAAARHAFPGQSLLDTQSRNAPFGQAFGLQMAVPLLA